MRNRCDPGTAVAHRGVEEPRTRRPRVRGDGLHARCSRPSSTARAHVGSAFTRQRPAAAALSTGRMILVHCAAMHSPAAVLRDVARYRVIFGDCDPMRIMYHANYLRLFEIGRAELFRQLGHPFPTYVAQGLYLAVVEATCRYRKPARYDDEVIIRAGFAAV